MSSTFYITRKKYWHDTGSNIPLEEWRAIVHTHPEMVLTEYSEVGLENGEVFRYPNPGAALWRKGTEEAEINYLNGNLLATGEPRLLLPVMKQLAFKLTANLQGEELECYELEYASPAATSKPAFRIRNIFAPFRGWLPSNW